MPIPVPIVVAAISTGLSIYQTIKADRDKKQAQEDMDNYQRQDLVNPYAQMRDYPKEALAMRKEAADVELATMANIASQAGRGLSIVAGAGNNYDKRIRQISADQEKYQYERDKMIAEGNAMVQSMQEERENMDIAGLAQLYGTADQNKNNALISLGNSLAYGAENAGDVSFSGLFGGGSKSSGQLAGSKQTQMGTEVTGLTADAGYAPWSPINYSIYD